MMFVFKLTDYTPSTVAHSNINGSTVSHTIRNGFSVLRKRRHTPSHNIATPQPESIAPTLNNYIRANQPSFQFRFLAFNLPIHEVIPNSATIANVQAYVI